MIKGVDSRGAARQGELRSHRATASGHHGSIAFGLIVRIAAGLAELSVARKGDYAQYRQPRLSAKLSHGHH
jgi:hypothetical protein